MATIPGFHVLVATIFLAFACTSCFLPFSTASSSAPATHHSTTSDDTDLQALLCLKLHLSDSDTAGAMVSWRNDSSVHYCSWPGVTCGNRHTSRVTVLHFDSANLSGRIPPCVGSLTFLRAIHLPNNQLNGHIPPELGSLTRLFYLNLSYNNLIGMIPSTLPSCSHLRFIDLSNNLLEGEIPSSLMNNTSSQLQEIILSNNKLNGDIPPQLGSLNRLSYLDLSYNHLVGMIPRTLCSCYHLQFIDLSNNLLEGEIPSSLMSNKSSQLEEIILSNNKLYGSIPDGIGTLPNLFALLIANNTLTGGIPALLANSSSLQWLDLTNNHLSREIPSALFNSSLIEVLGLGRNNFVGSVPPLVHILSPLDTLILSDNNLSGSIPSSLGNFSSLTWLLLSQNNFQGAIPSSLGMIPSLEQLDLSFNNLSGSVPASLYNKTTLTYLSVGTNRLSGEIPYDIGFALPNIQTLILQENHFHGQIPASLGNANYIQVMDLRDNLFHGVIPSFGNLSSLTGLNLGMNQLEAGDWSFLSSLTNCSQLVLLCLDKNILKGELPISIGNLPRSLQVLLLRENQISGAIPPEIEHLKNLTLLYMEHNLLAGDLPDSIGNLPNLFVLSLSQNKLSGQVPLSIGKLSQLSELYLQENNFSGLIPRALGSCKNLEALNLSRNGFTGSIPKELFTLSSLAEGLDLSHNQLSGEIPSEIGGLINLDVLNISSNQLSGTIPSTLGSCVHLGSLHMEGNLLHGAIPESFISLRGISEMDLSRNYLSGELPGFFELFSSMKLLNLSFNNLEGPVPTGGIFRNIGEVVFVEGNKLLCANSIPLPHLPLCSEVTSKKRKAYGILKIAGCTALSLAIFSCFVVVLSKKRKKVKQESRPPYKELRKFSYADLVKATNDFSLANLIGSGKSASVYKCRLRLEEDIVAIKVFKLDHLDAPKSFVAECEVLRNTRHRNLVRVITACSTFDPSGHPFKALILEYMLNGSLESWLYPDLNRYGLRSQLTLGTRITIAMDVASALDYLHNHCVPPVIHCDLKPSNVLLDDVMCARLADFGLAKFLQSYSHQSSTSLFGPRGSIGYIAPEYGLGSKLSAEGDVYSYGIIILELLTGKCPTDEMFTNGLNLHRFVENVFPQKIGEILDPCIVQGFQDDGDVYNNLEHGNNVTAGVETCILHLVKVGLLCSVETPKERPSMQDVYTEVITIKEAFAALRG